MYAYVSMLHNTLKEIYIKLNKFGKNCLFTLDISDYIMKRLRRGNVVNLSVLRKILILPTIFSTK